MNPHDQPTDHSRQAQDFQPGQSVSPNQGGVGTSAGAPPAPVEPAAAPSLYNAYDDSGASDSSMTTHDPFAAPAPRGSAVAPDRREIAWTAAEFVEHQKSPGWFLTMIAAAIAVVGVVFFITRDWFSTAIVAVAAVIFGFVAARPPRQMHYAVNDHGVAIGSRLYPFENFRSFSVMVEEAANSIVLMPLKRFMPPLNLYYDPADEDAIGNLLAAHLPYEQHEHELTERLMRRIRF